MGLTLKTKNGLSGSSLKIIAIVIMLIDHIAAGIIIPYTYVIQDKATFDILINIYYAMRCIGRIAFPIFCFLLVEGFVHTKNVKKYILSLGLFALISEIPFDLNFSNTIFSLEYQNVFFTLFVALIALMGFKTMEERYKDNNILKWILIATITVLACIVANILKTDYSAMGILTVASFYLFRDNKLQPVIAFGVLIISGFAFNGFYMAIFELPAIFSIPLIYMYNKQRGINLKYFFYLFYPVHLIIIYFIAQALTN